MKNLRSGLLLSIVCSVSSSALAQETVVWSGWMDFGSCNRMKTYTDDFGIEWPTNESVGQTLSGEVYFVGTVQDWIVNRVKSCAIAGVAAAGTAAFLTQGAGAWPTFSASFNACMSDTGITDIISDNLGFRTDTHCNW